MNVRTNLRTWRDGACYIVQVGERGSKTNPHIYAELKAVAVDRMSHILLADGLGKFRASDELFFIEGERTAQKAVEKAIKLFKIAKKIH